ncbi:MAG: hypothetical protein AAF570_01510 [Bacteroidota bacterium]
MKLKTLFYSCCLLFLAGCGGNIVLDNPREEAVVFTFNSTDGHEVAAQTSATISLDPGTYRVEVTDKSGEVLGDTTFKLSDGKEGIVHSGGSNYLVWRQLYGLQKDRKTLLNERWVEFDSIRTYGDFKVYPKSWLFIEKNWDHDLNTPLPESRNLHITKDFVIEAKVFRTDDFIETYRKLARASRE